MIDLPKMRVTCSRCDAIDIPRRSRSGVSGIDKEGLPLVVI
jgi:hypothetical protein